MFAIGRLSIGFSKSLSQIKLHQQQLQHRQKLTLSAFQLQSHRDNGNGRHRSTNNDNDEKNTILPVGIAYLAYLLFFKEAECSSDCDHLVDVDGAAAGEGKGDGCANKSNDNEGEHDAVKKSEQACRRCPTILPATPASGPTPISVTQVKDFEAVDVKENYYKTLPACEEQSSSPPKQAEAQPTTVVVAPPLQVAVVEVEVEEKEENFEIKSLETQSPSRKITVDKDGDRVNEAVLSSTNTNISTSKLVCEANVDKSLLSKVLQCLGFAAVSTKMEKMENIKFLDEAEAEATPIPCPGPCPHVEDLIVREDVQLEKSLKEKNIDEKCPEVKVVAEKCSEVKVVDIKSHEVKVFDEKRCQVMAVDDKYGKKKDFNGNVNGNDCSSTSLLTRIIKPFNYCFPFFVADSSQKEDHNSAYAPPIYPPNCECKPPLQCLRDAQELSHKYLIKQANVLSLDSINRILSETISTLHDLHIEYRVLLRNLWNLLDDRLVFTNGVKAELLDCNILYLRGRIEEHAKSIAELDCYLSQVLNLVDCAAEVASCGGADVASHIFCEQYSSMLFQIKAIKTETQCVEDDLADFQKVFYVKTGQALI